MTTVLTDRPIKPSSQSVSADPALYGARYDMIDCWRGLAALAVLMTHMGLLSAGVDAVMLFFVISGYCITAASESGLQRKMPFRSFMWRRFRRIYPPYLFALGFFVLTRIAKVAMTGEGFPRITPLQWIQNVLLLQWLSLPKAWPTQAPENQVNVVAAFWSLQYEEQFYLLVACIMCAGAFVARSVTLLLMAVSAALVLTLSRRGATGLFLDYWVHFAIGAVVFYRLCRMPANRWRYLVDVTFALTAIGCWYLASHIHHSDDRPIWREFATVLTFAFVLVQLRRFDVVFTRTWLGKLLMLLGLISYSLYLVHQFNLTLAAGIASKLLRGGPAWAVTMMTIGVHLAIATVFWFLCERPFLNRKTNIAKQEHGPEIADAEDSPSSIALPSTTGGHA